MSSIDGGDDHQVPWDAQSHASTGPCEEKIFVAVRLRPLNAKEISSNDFSVWECIDNNTIVFKNSLGERTMHPNAYRFDRVFGGECSTKEVYDEAAKEVATSVVNGINSSIFAYGQTSSGKTYTMAGITQHTVDDIFAYIDQHPEREFALKFAAMEIYNEAVRDLLSSDGTQLRVLDDPERGTVVEKLSEEVVKDKSHLMQLLALCEAQRQIGETNLNETSSRSHQILRLTVESSVRQIAGTTNTSTLSANVNFVDLAGSERASQTMSAGVRLKEGSHINRSLLTLGTVIRKLSKGRNSHVPFRDSKLTRILQNSLGGNARTAIICTLSPAHSYLEQSRNTLFFGSCAKQVSTNAQVNIVMSDKALVKQLRKELSRMEGELKYISSISVKGDYSALLREKELQIEKMDKEIKELSKQRDIALSEIDKLLQTAEHKQTLTKQVQSQGLRERRRIPLPGSPVVPVKSSYLRSDMDLKTIEAFNHLTPNSKTDLNDRDSDCWEISEDELLGVETVQSAQKTDQEDSEENCKEVHCIEVEAEKSNKKTTESNLVRNSQVNETKPSGAEVNAGHSPEEFDALVKRIRELQGAIDNLVSQKEEVENSSGSPGSDTSSCAEYSLFRSRSCKAVMMDSPSSPLFDRSLQNIDVLVDGFNRKSSSRPENLPRPPSDLRGLNTDRSSTGISDYNSIRMALMNEMGENRLSIGSNRSSSIHHGFTSLDNDSINRNEYGSDGQLLQGSNPVQELQMRTRDDKTMEFNITAENTMVSPTHNSSLQDFEQKRKKIIELWDACNTSVIHRSYFFLLFQGDDPSDSVYIEVEARRLSYILSKFSQSGKIRMENQILTPASSIKALNQERDMLSRQMNKKLTPKERESLFMKWGIKLESKKRKLQLARRLWTDNKEMEHIQESANLVAKLAGLFDEGGQVPKEIFVGPNFSPKTLNRRSYSWRGSFTSRV